MSSAELSRPIFQAVGASFAAFPQFSLNISNLARTAVYGPQKRDLLNIVAGKVSDPSKRARFPGIGHDMWPSQAIQFVSFGQSTSASAQAPFVGARYESFRDEHDESLESVLRKRAPQSATPADIQAVSDQLDLTQYWPNWYVGLSNGQSRRAQLAEALLRKPRLLVMDEPFLGLDPANRAKFSAILEQLPIPVVIGLRGGEPLPSWINQVVFAGNKQVVEGEPARALIAEQASAVEALRAKKAAGSRRAIGGPAIEMRDVTVRFKQALRPIFDKLSFSVNEGERVHIRGPNGSGKSTLLALITADHPQSWSNDVRLFGERLRVGKHSYFSINKLIGHTSPEVHAIFPRFLTARRAIATAFTHSMIPPTKLTPEQTEKIEDIAGKLGIDLDGKKFGDMSLSEQKLVLFARALVHSPRILILDEAFSTLSNDQIEQAFDLVDQFDGTVLVVGHVDEEIPAVDKQIVLG